MSGRVDQLLQCLKLAQMDASIISGKENRRYFSGFTGSSGMVFIHPAACYLITDFRYIEQGKIECPDFKVVDAPGLKAGDFVKGLCEGLGIQQLWFEEDVLTYKEHHTLTDAVKPAALVPDGGAVAKLRMVKSPEEIDKIRRAAALSDLGFSHLLRFIQPNMTEREVALELEFFLRKNGSDGLAFATIAASGINGALPHAQPGDKKLKMGELLTLDFGCILNGYCSDMTRTISFGQPPEALREIYQITLEAQLAVLEGLKPGITGVDADKLARDHITSMGYGAYFGHGLGHGVGLHVHEAPTLSPRGTETLAKGMVVTVEPGIYLPQVGGVRIEDLVVITEDGYENMTSSPKDLIII